MRITRVASLVVAVALGACDTVPPVLIDMTPDDGADVRGARAFPLAVAFTDDSAVHVSVEVDGEMVGTAPVECTDNGCTARTHVDTTGLAIGEHQLAVVLEDEPGNVTREERTFVADDILTVTSLRVTGETDGLGALELEVYAWTDDNQLIGCAGSRHGLDGADASDVTYTLDASLIDMMGDKLSTGDLGSTRFRLEVWEDDDDPVCSVVPDPQGNTLIGASASYTADEWRTQVMPIMFGRVTEFAVEWTRDLPAPAPKDMQPPPDDDDFGLDFGREGGGCSTTGGSGGLLIVLAALLARRRRR